MNSKKLQDPLWQYLEDQKNEMVALTQTLCGFATENPPGRDYQTCAEFLASTAEQFGLQAEMMPVPEAYQQEYGPPESQEYPRFNVIARWDAGASKTLHFNSHYDVVPATSDWQTDPFAPVVRGAKLVGRGTMDMKGCLVASLFAAKALQACGHTPPWNLEFSFTADEEIGGRCGVGYLANQQIIQPDAAVVCEGGMGEIISYGNRGLFWGNITVHGVSGHGSTPSHGVNAFEHGVEIAQKLLQLHKSHRKRPTLHHMMDPEHRHPTLTLGGIAGGGSKVNTIPDRFMFSFDRRLLAEEKVDEIRRAYQSVLESTLKSVQGASAELEVLSAFDSGFTDPKHAFCKTAQKAVRRVLGRTGKLKMFGAFSDQHYFTNVLKCPTIGYGVEGAGLHGSDEYLLIDSLTRTARVYAEIALMMPETQ